MTLIDYFKDKFVVLSLLLVASVGLEMPVAVAELGAAVFSSYGMIFLVSLCVTGISLSGVAGWPVYRALIFASIFIPYTFATGFILATWLGDTCIIGAERVDTILYFSYVTLTTLGYGDLQPLGVCRALAVVEALFGFICLGIVISSIVSSNEKESE